MKVRPHTDADTERWDDLVDRSARGTFLHSRRFLSYHGQRFTDCSLICADEKDQLLGVFPAALVPGDATCVASHPGATYGGLLCEETGGGDRVAEMLAAIFDHYRSRGLRRLEYKSVPPHVHSVSSQLDVQAIWRMGGVISRRDVWNVLTLGCRPEYSRNHSRAIGRARKRGVVTGIADGGESYRAFHAILGERLGDRYGVAPVHTLEEMLMLREQFPQDISLWLARDDGGRVIAGTWLFMFGTRAWHTQYIASTADGRDSCATHLLFDRIIQEAEAHGVRFLSFGRSSEEGGRLNDGLYAFKAGFGAGAVCHDTYLVNLA